ncbi:MAG: hypothetical protein RH917_15145 [Lacipirellulaceae bacterium]
MKPQAKKEANSQLPTSLARFASINTLLIVPVIPLPIFLLAIVALFASGSGRTQAKELSVRAVATVTDIEQSGTVDFQFPLNLSVGDVGSFQADFNDLAFPRGARFSGGFGAPGITTRVRNIHSEVRFGSAIVLSDSATLLAIRHDPHTSGTPENPGVIAIGEHVSIYGSGDASEGGYAWRTTGYFSTAGDSLSGGELVSDILDGALITTRQLFMRVTQPGSTGAYEVSAMLSEVTVVPEPNSSLTALLASIYCLCPRCRRTA